MQFPVIKKKKTENFKLKMRPLLQNYSHRKTITPKHMGIY
jgi:hypothetical protein